ncbi:MAG: TonB-dependent receptor domain-containing protein [Vicinamibacterales bacterium]
MSRVRSLAFAAASLAALPAPPLAAEGSVAGTVTDATGAPASGVEVTLVSPLGAITATTRSDAAGAFRFETVPAGSYVLSAELPGFAARKRAVQVVSKGALDGLKLDLQPGGFRDEVTIRAAPGRADAQDGVAQRVNVIDEERLALRAKAVLSQAANEEVGLHLQRTSPTMGGIFVRGLTGTKVNVYVDGVRYTTSAQRGGVSTFFNMVEPQALEGIEVVRGPSSAEYGSDALGGTVQLLTRAPSFDPSGERVSGSWSASAGSADLSFGSALVGRYAAPTLGVIGTLAGRRVNTLRAASGEDSRNAVTRFLGLPSETAIDDGRLPDTAFTQYGGQLRANWAITPTTQLVAGYLRGQQDGGKRYDQLLGGDGNLQADLRNLMVDHLYARLDKAGLGFLDRVTLSYSFASQREERRNQGGNGNPLASVNHEPERSVAHGLQATASRSFGRHDLTLGADVFLEGIAAPSFATNPTSGATTVRRGRVPDDPSYDHGGVFLQDVFEAVPGRLRLNGAVRFSAASYEVDTSPTLAGNGTPLWPADSYDTSAPTFRIGALFTPSGPLSVAVNVSRGFRAPDITDLGTFGLTGSGYEVSNREVDGLGASVGTTADATAVSTGHAVAVLDPESSLSYELTLRYRSRRLRADLTGFQNDISDNIAKQTLILPPGALGLSLAGEPVTRQLPTGAVFVAVSANPVLVRTNFEEARIRGLEASFGAELTPSFFLAGLATWLHAEDLATGLPPNIEGGTPAPDGWLRLRYTPGGGRRFWIEPYLHAAAEQDRISSLDLGDRRTGASRSRSSIAAFFTNGARARGLVSPGTDGIPGNADDLLTPTGETLAQVQERVLGPSGVAQPLFPTIPGYVVFGVRGAIRFAERHEILFDLENIGDESYRGVSWGMDAPGRGLYLRYSLSF